MLNLIQHLGNLKIPIRQLADGMTLNLYLF